MCTSSSGSPVAEETSPYVGSASRRTHSRPRRAKACAKWVATKVAPTPPRAPCTATIVARFSSTNVSGTVAAVAPASSSRSPGQR